MSAMSKHAQIPIVHFTQRCVGWGKVSSSIPISCAGSLVGTATAACLATAVGGSFAIEGSPSVAPVVGAAVSGGTVGEDAGHGSLFTVPATDALASASESFVSIVIGCAGSLIFSTSARATVGSALAMERSVFSSAEGMASSTSVSLVSIASSKATPALSTIVSNCENGRLTKSFIALSGVKVILSRPSITMRSPVFTSTLSRALMGVSLNAPRPFTLTNFSDNTLSCSVSINCVTKCSASAAVNSCFSTKCFASSFKLIIPFLSTL